MPALQHGRVQPLTGLKSRTSDLPSVFTKLCQLSIEEQPTHLPANFRDQNPAFSQDSVTFALSIAFTHFDPWTEMPCEPHLSLSLITGKLTSNPPITCPSLLVSPGPPCHGLVSLHPTAGTCVPPHCPTTTESTERAKPHRPL